MTKRCPDIQDKLESRRFYAHFLRVVLPKMKNERSYSYKEVFGDEEGEPSNIISTIK